MVVPKVCEKIQEFPNGAGRWIQDLEPALQKLALIEPYSVIHNPENWPLRRRLDHFFRDIMRCRADYPTTLEHFSNARTYTFQERPCLIERQIKSTANPVLHLVF